MCFLSFHRQNMRWTFFYWPYSDGRLCKVTPVRKSSKAPLIKCCLLFRLEFLFSNCFRLYFFHVSALISCLCCSKLIFHCVCFLFHYKVFLLTMHSNALQQFVLPRFSNKPLFLAMQRK